MQAAIALLGQADVAGQGRRIAVLGDMLELGPSGADLHRGLVEPVVAQGIDLVFCCGPLMHSLWEALPSERRGGYAETSAALEPQVLAAIRAGDAIMVKGSLGSRMGPIVKALEQSYSRNRARGAKPRLTNALLAFLPVGPVQRAQRVPLHHDSHRRRDDNGDGLRVPVRTDDHRQAAHAAGQGTADPHRRAAVASRHQEGHAHHGRPDDPARHRGGDGAVGEPGEQLRVDRARRDAELRRDRLLRRLPQGHAADPCRLFRQVPTRLRNPGRGGRVLLYRVAWPPAVRIVARRFRSSRTGCCRSAGSSWCSALS